MSDKLLSTRDAAKYLQVSEASIRRWSDAGLLPAGRVGVRKARRFREADLSRFIRHPAHGGPMSNAPMVSFHGKAIPLGTHLASFYGSDSGRLRQGLPLLVDALQADEPALLYAIPPVEDRYKRALREQGHDVKTAERNGLLTTMPVARTTPERWISYFEELLTKVSRRHAGPIRVVAEAAAALKCTGSPKGVLQQERLVASVVKRFPVVPLCLYDVRVFDGPTLLEALKLHGDVFDYGLGYFLD